MSLGKVDQAVMPVPAGTSSDHWKAVPLKSARVMPRFSEYHFARALGSLERRKTPPMPVTLAIATPLVLLERLYESCDGAAVDGVSGQGNAFLDVIGEAADDQDGGSVEEDYIARRAWFSGKYSL